MDTFSLSENFNAFFKCINPRPTYEQRASKIYSNISSIIENPSGLARALSPKCFLQGSYKQDTAIYTINDLDIMVYCYALSFHSTTSECSRWIRDNIFDTVAAPLKRHYSIRIKYSQSSMCIKLDLGIKVEILPVFFMDNNRDPQKEPFNLYRPETGKWEKGFARFHQTLLTEKNKKTDGNFIPAIKVLKHLRSLRKFSNISSFHLECLLYYIPDSVFLGSPAEYISSILSYINSISSQEWYDTNILTPCRDRYIFSDTEWSKNSWQAFYSAITQWAKISSLAFQANNKEAAVMRWRALLGNYFPRLPVSWSM
jgi:hypothetical protein